MKIPKRKIDKVSVEWQNNRKKELVQHITKLAHLYAEDPEKKTREKEHLCKVCYYDSSRVGGSAITTTECAMCTIKMVFSNTCVDVLCDDCAKKAQLCKHCGSDIHYVNRRNREGL